jgi:sugar phosphate permease
LLAFFWYGTYMVVQGLWGGPYLMDVLGMTRQLAGKMLLLIATGYIVGSMLIGTISNDLIGSRKRTLLVGQTLLLLAVATFLGPAERMGQPLLMVLLFFVGVAVSSGVMIYPMAKEMVPVSASATAMTAANFFVLIGAAVIQQVMGLVIENSRFSLSNPAQMYHAGFMVPIIGLGVAILSFSFCKESGGDCK